MADQTDIQAVLKERFAQLPKVVQNAITSEDNAKHLRELGEQHKLHIDQWEILENEVMMALFGIIPIDDLEQDIKQKVGVSGETAAELAADISKIVFEPIREELERQLDHPDAKAVDVSGVEGMRAQALSEEAQEIALVPEPVLPATPPAQAPAGTIERAPISAAYKAGETSTARKMVEDDPYREPPV
jgi:tRNA A22 N-methylase